MPVTQYDQNLFANTCNIIVNNERNKNGIGTLQEKTLHAVLKNFYEPDISHQEVKVERFVADILRKGEIIEIQTCNFNNMRKKLNSFLKFYPVTIVYPIIHVKYLYWVNEETGEVSSGRKSPKRGSFYDAFHELYKIKPFLTNPNLHICLTLIDAEEYRILNGWSKDKKRGSTRYDRIPISLVDELYIGSISEYMCLIPKEVPEEFTVKDYEACTHISNRYSQLAINIFKYIGIIEQIGKRGRCYLYRRK